MENNETKVVKIHDVKLDQEYVQWRMKQWYLYSSSAGLYGVLWM